MFERLKTLLRPPETKASRTARLIAFEQPGRARWTPRDYATLTREGFAANAIVYRAVKLVAENAAVCPYLLYEGSTERDTHPLLDLIARPNPRQDGARLLEAVQAYLLLAGNAYIEAVTIDGTLRELYALRPDRMKVMPGPDGWAEAYLYTVGGRSVRFDQEAQPIPPILHLTNFHPLDDHYGLSPLEAAAVAVDTTNPFSAKLNNALWVAKTVAEGGDGDMRYKLSKESAANTLSMLFQDNFSGRAEIGLTGDDDFHFKTSPDGTTFNDAIVLDKTTAATRINSALCLAGDISPAQITADQNDYNPAGLSTASVLRISTDASHNITGLSGGGDGRVLAIVNVGSNGVVLKDASSSSSAANRFAFGADLTLAPNQGALLIYDATTSRWRALATLAGSGLLAANNLSDVASAATARGNLAVAGTGVANTFSDATDATSSTAAAQKFSGGIAVAKKAYIGDDLRVVGGAGTTRVVRAIANAVTFYIAASDTFGGYGQFGSSGGAFDLLFSPNDTEQFRVVAGGGLQMGGANTIFTASRHPVLRSYTVGTAPSVSPAWQMIAISNESGGATPAFSDGTNWRRFADRAVIS